MSSSSSSSKKKKAIASPLSKSTKTSSHHSTKSSLVSSAASATSIFDVYSAQEDRNQIRIPGGPGGVSTDVFVTGNGQYYFPEGRSFPQGKVSMPAAFDIGPPAVEVEPLHLPKLRGQYERPPTPVEIDWDGPDAAWKKERVAIKLRHLFYVSWYFGFLKASVAANNGTQYGFEEITDEIVLFEILIKETISAIHRIYLDKNSQIRRLLLEVIRADDLSVCLAEARQGAPMSPALEHVVYLLENLVYQVTYIQPKTGVLGTNFRSYLIGLIKDGQLFPLDEFWEMERRRLRFDHTGRTINSGLAQSSLLLMMVFMARGLVWTLMMHPEEYQLVRTEPPLSRISRNNLRLISTLLLFVYRRVIIPRNTYRIPEPPREIAHLLLDDNSIKPLVERIENSLHFCDGLIREWAQCYVLRLKNAENKK